MDKSVAAEFGQILDVLDSLWTDGTMAENGLPGSAAERARLHRFLASVIEAQTVALTLAAEQRPSEPKSQGVMIDALKKLQKKLTGIQERVRRVAAGDFTQRMDSGGEFAVAFNEMIKNMEDKGHQLRRRDAEIFHANALLQKEVEERVKAQARLEVANSTLQAQILEIQSLQAKLREQAIRDSLTSLYNRRFLEETLDREVAAAARSHSSLTIIMLDLDYFKEFNDRYGHAAGDAVLRVVGSLLRGNTRSSDVSCRYGGEEFIVVLPGAGLELARERAEYLRMVFAQTEISFGGRILKATLSAGVSAYPTHGSTREELIRAADTALYGAKRLGRNRVVLAS
jgi:diguanylate cyclase (GGDEF)-like protein